MSLQTELPGCLPVAERSLGAYITDFGKSNSAESAVPVVGFGRRQSVDQAVARNSQTSVTRSAFSNLPGTLTRTNHYALCSLLSWLGSYYRAPNQGSGQAAFLSTAAAGLPPHLLSWAA